jgi:hypothetical protein
MPQQKSEKIPTKQIPKGELSDPWKSNEPIGSREFITNGRIPNSLTSSLSLNSLAIAFISDVSSNFKGKIH